MTDTEILLLGELSQALLVSSEFETIVAQYKQSIASDIMATTPADTAKREQLYFSLLGVEGLLEFMKLQAAAAAHIKSPKPPEDVTKEYPTIDYAFDEQYDGEGFSVTNEENS